MRMHHMKISLPALPDSPFPLPSPCDADVGTADVLVSVYTSKHMHAVRVWSNCTVVMVAIILK